MNDTVKKFGDYVTGQISRHPVRARRLLASAFRGYGIATRYGRNKDDLPARKYLMYLCNEAMAGPLKHPGNTVIVSIFTPCEFFQALGLKVVFPEGLGCYMTASGCEKIFLERAEECGVPESLCSYHKMLIGMAETGVLPKPRFIVNTTMACDANQLSFRYLAEYFGVPHFVLDIPTGCSGKNVEYLSTQLQDMVAFLEKHTGRKLDPDRLRAAVSRAQKTIANYRKILALKATRHERTKITYHMMDIFAIHVLLGTRETLKYTEKLIRDLSALPKETPGTRIMWVHTMPYWQESVADIYNYSDKAEVVCCDMIFDNIIDLDPDKPYESLSRQILSNHFNGSADRRISRVIAYSERMNIDGILYFCHWGCKQTLGTAAMAKQKFEEAGFPTLTLDGDGCDSRNIQDGQMVTRIGAFMEQLEAQK
jgi:benzoyl-CoA reductase/2-hydroxyglutaryl-CoA dehydratase subunit BcrC/BadD/HgdB